MINQSRPGWKKRLKPAVERAVRFLVERRTPGGWWRDFETLAGPSDEWVTAYVACALARVPGGRSAARHAVRILLNRWRGDGWGYNQSVPADVDSTAWVCRLLETFDRAAPLEQEAALKWLRTARRLDGFPTYPVDAEIRAFTRLPPHQSFAGWTAPHSCVTAAALALSNFARDRRLRSALRSQRRADGSWTGYWWDDSAYPTMLAADAIGRDQALMRWAKESREDSAFALACRQRCGASTAVALLDLQQADGGWLPSARLRIPPPDAVHPDSGARVSLDQNRLFTTATALWALHEQSCATP